MLMKTHLYIFAGALIFLSASPTSVADSFPLHASLFPRTLPIPEGQFGQSVAASAEYIVIGAPTTAFGEAAQNYGVVFVHSAATGTLVATLRNPNPAGYSYFGSSVAVSGRRIVVGAFLHNAGPSVGGVAYLYDLSSATPAVPMLTFQNPTGVREEYFGAAVAIAGDHVVVGAPRADTVGDNAGAAYLFDLASATPALPVVIANPRPHPRNGFGSAVAISASRVVIGAPGGTVTAEGTFDGGVYVYDLRSSPLAGPALILSPPGPGYFEQFGSALAIEGNRVAVGAPHHRLPESPNTPIGAAYVYDLGSATPQTPTQFTFAGVPDATDENFGISVALAGNRLAVGTLVEMNSTTPGPVFIYDLSGAAPTTPEIIVHNPAPAFYDLFGSAVALAADRLFVGAPYDDPAGYDSGAVYSFDLASAEPTRPVRTLSNSLPPTRERFGSAVATEEDHLLVGSPFAVSLVRPQGGAAYLYHLNSATPTVPRATFTAPDPQAGFGKAVAISGNIVVVGSPFYYSRGLETVGIAYVFDLQSATPGVPVLTIENAEPSEYEHFGWAVAVSGTRVAVGVPHHSGTADFAVWKGAVFLFDLSSATPATPVRKFDNPTPAEGEEFGYSVALSGNRLVVGARRDDTGADDAGAVYVYDLGSATPTVPVRTLPNPAPGVREYFGHSVALWVDWLVIGQPFDAATQRGAAYVYDLAVALPTAPAVTLSSGDATANDGFGWSVAIRGTRVAVGAGTDEEDPGDPPVPTGAGLTYIYELSNATPREPVAILNNPTPAATDSFGSAVAVSRHFVIAGAPGDDTLNFDEGAAYVLGVPVPDISVEQPAGVALIDGAAAVDFGAVVVGTSSTRTFTIRNDGGGDLNGLGIVIRGGDDFIAPTPLALPLPPGASTTFTVSFSPRTTGAKSGTLQVETNDPDESPFDVALTGRGVPAGDSDGDGLSDADEVNLHGTNPNLFDTDGDQIGDGTEVNLSRLGFEPLVDSSALRALLHSNARGVGLYGASDVQNLALGRPLLERDPSSGTFTLRLGLERSTDLRTWSPLTGFTPTYSAITGEIILEFAPGAGGAEFYRIFGSRP